MGALLLPLLLLPLQTPWLVESALPQSGLLADFQADSGVRVDAATGQVIEWADKTGKHKALPNNTATANRQQRAVNAATDPTYLTEHGHGLPPLSALHQQTEPHQHDSSPVRYQTTDATGRFPAGVLFDGDDYLRLPQPAGWQPRRGGFTVIALFEPLGSGTLSQLTQAAAALTESKALHRQTDLNKGRDPKSKRKRSNQLCFWLGLGNPGVGDVQWTLSSLVVAEGRKGKGGSAASKQLVMAQVVPTAFDVRRPSVRNSVSLEGRMTDASMAVPSAGVAEDDARALVAVSNGTGGAGKMLVSLTLDGSTAAGRLNGLPLFPAKRLSAQRGFGAAQYADGPKTGPSSQAGLDFDWEIANDEYGYYSFDNPQDFYIGTGPSAEDHLSYTGDGAAGWVYAVAIYGRELSLAELDAAEQYLACKYGAFQYAFAKDRDAVGSIGDAELRWAASCRHEEQPPTRTTKRTEAGREDL